MTTTKVQREIDAPVERVFDTIAHIQNYSKAVPWIVRTEIISNVDRGKGTRFRETRVMHGKEMATELEVTEYEPNRHVRIVSQERGTVWDTLFTVEQVAGGTLLTMVMEATSDKLVPMLTNPLLKGLIKNAIEKDMDAVKSYCEGKSISG